MEEVSTKEAFSKFKPSRCVFVISIDKNGKPNGMIASQIMRCASEPTMIAISLWKKGYTHKLIQQSKEFVIAVPNKELEGEVNIFGAVHGDKTDKFKKTGIEIEKAKFGRTPLIKKATINFECKLVKEVDSGDHIIFIGRILASYINKGKKVLLNTKKIGKKRIYQEF